MWLIFECYLTQESKVKTLFFLQLYHIAKLSLFVSRYCNLKICILKINLYFSVISISLLRFNSILILIKYLDLSQWQALSLLAPPALPKVWSKFIYEYLLIIFLSQAFKCDASDIRKLVRDESRISSGGGVVRYYKWPVMVTSTWKGGYPAPWEGFTPLRE